MSNEPQFLSFKGLKSYSPQEGWGQVNDIVQNHVRSQDGKKPSAAAHQPSPEIPTLTETPEQTQGQDPTQMFDPLITELFDQLRSPPTDELTQTWRTIAAEVNLLTQRMALHRELTDRLEKLDADIAGLRSTILHHLQEVQQAADQQLTSARLRAEVSALAQSKLSAKLKNSP
jgi:hypothetical protein